MTGVRDRLLLSAGSLGALAVALLVLLVLSGPGLAAKAAPGAGAAKSPRAPGLKTWTAAHAGRESVERLGGPIDVDVDQDSGRTVFVLPGPRFLDPSVFGAPGDPAGFYPVGLPVAERLAGGDDYSLTDEVTPFSDWVEPGRGSLHLHARDATAFDAKSTEDRIDLTCEFTAPDGATYTVTCRKALPHGADYPDFGGVVTNTILHGASGVGTRLMPTEFAYLALWGSGTLSRNGKVVAENRLVHLMVTEDVRGADGRLWFDGQVGKDPKTKTVHLMLPPFEVADGGLEPSPLPTGFDASPFVKRHLADASRAAEDGNDARWTPETVRQAKQVMARAGAAGTANGQPFLHVMFHDFTMTAGTK